LIADTPRSSVDVTGPEGRSGRPAAEPDAPTRPRGSQVWWTVAGITVLLWGLELFGYVDLYPALSVAVVVLVLWGLGTIVSAWQPHDAPSWVRRATGGATVALTVGAFLVWSLLQILAKPAYGTDEVAFDQYAAQLLRHGLNPYTHSMAPAFSLFHVSPDGYTFLLDGHTVTALSYPSLSFLAYLPFLLLGWSSEMAVVVNVLAWATGIVLAYVLLPRPIRPVALVIGSLSVYIAYAVGGVTDALFVPLLIGAAYRWDRFAWARGPKAWMGPALLGLAMAVKQTPWLLLPFLVAAVALEARRLGAPRAGLAVGARYLGIALAAFAVPNLPFVVLSPHAWINGVLTPIASHTVPAGQGLVGLSLFLGLGGGSLAAYTVAVVVISLSLWVVFVISYPLLRSWAFLAPTLVLVFSARSFGSYLVTLVPAGLVAATTLGVGAPDPGPSARPVASRRTVRAVVAGAVTLSAVSVGAIYVHSAPLSIRITSVRTTGQLATVVQVGVEVVNTSGHPERPAFTVESSGQLTSFWLSRGGPSMIRPGRRAHYTLYAPDFFAQPPITGGFQVVAFGSAPASVSRSPSYLPTSLHLGISPAAVPGVVPLGRPVTLRVTLLDHLDRPVTEAGVPVYLGQVIYGQQGLVFGQAIIDRGQVGQTPVVAYTDGHGVATFTVQGTQPSDDPVSFEANLVDDRQFYPYGYSDIVPIRFGAP
jgi:uncharacterized membrane protein